MIIDGTRAHDRATTLVLDYYAAFNRGDREAMLALLTDDVAHDLNQGPRETGRDAFAAFMARMDLSYREQLRDIVVMASPDGSRAAAEYVVHGEYLADDDGLPPANGQRYVLPGGAFFDLRDGRIARVTNYSNLQDWIAQVGG
ncbi:MAG: ketosteroid isomerase-related protein [Lysobacteraceae bacterium]